MSQSGGNSIRALLDSLANEYDALAESKSKLEADCGKLREFIDIQIQNIQNLRMDFEKLRNEHLNRKDDMAPRQPISAPPQEAQPQEEQQEFEQVWEVNNLPTQRPIPHPIRIQLIAEIVDLSVICSTAFSPDSTSLAIGSNKTLRVYNINEDSFILQFQIDESEETSNHIRSLAWTPDCKYVICGGEDHLIRVFDMQSNPPGSLVATFEAGAGEVFQVQCSRDGKFFVTATGDGALSVWNLPAAGPDVAFQRLWTASRETSSSVVATSLSLSNEDRYVAVGYSDTVTAIWDLESRTCLLEKESHKLGVYAVRFIPNSRLLATSSLDNTVKLWEFTVGDAGVSLSLWKSLEEHDNFVLALAADPTGRWLLSGSKDLTAKLTSVEIGEMCYSVKSHTNSVITVAFNPTGTMFCTGSGDMAVKIWSISDQQ